MQLKIKHKKLCQSQHKKILNKPILKKLPKTAFSSTTIRNTFGLKYMNSGPGPGSYE